MKMHIQALLLLLAFLVSAPATAPGLSSSSLNELIKLFDINKQVPGIRAVVDGLEQALNESIAKLAASLSRIFVIRKDA